MRIITIITKLKNSIFWKSVAVLISGTTLAQSIGLLTAPIVSRLYDPKAFGEFTIIFSTASIIANIVTLGLNSAIMVPVNDEESDEVFMVTFFTMLLFSTVILIVIFLASPLIHFFDPGMNYLLACILVYGFVIINNLTGLLDIYINRKRIIKALFYNPLIGAFTTLCITIPLGIMNLGSFGLIVAAIFAGVVSIIQMIHHANPFKKIPSLKSFTKVYRKYKNFIIYQYPSNFIGNLAIQLPTQALSAEFGNTNLGSYSMNEKVLGIPSRLIGNPINTIYFRTASEYHKEGKNLADFTFSLVTKIMLAAFLPITIIVFWGEPIFTWVLGPNWGEAGNLAGFLILQYVFMFCTNCISYCRVVIGKQKVNFLVSVLQLVIIGMSIFAGIKLFGDLLNIIVFLTIGNSLYLIIDMAINFRCMGKYCLKYLAFALGYFFATVMLWFISGKLQ